MGDPGVHFWGVGLGRHEGPVCPVEDQPLGVSFEDVNRGSFGGVFQGCVKGVPRCEGYFHSGGVDVQGGRAAEKLINVEGHDWVFGALGWWGHRWDGRGVPVVYVGGDGVKGSGDHVLGLCHHDDVALCAEVLR